MGESKILLLCSASEEKKFKKWFGSMVANRSEDPESKFPYCLPVFRCEDRVKVRDKITAAPILQVETYYSSRCFSPSRHIRVGTIYGNSYKELLQDIEDLKKKEEEDK